MVIAKKQDLYRVFHIFYYRHKQMTSKNILGENMCKGVLGLKQDYSSTNYKSTIFLITDSISLSFIEGYMGIETHF